MNKSGLDIRKEWIMSLHKIVHPIIGAMAEEKLREVLPCSEDEKKRGVAFLEAIGRTVCGIAPWLELDSNEIIDLKERELQQEYRELTRKAMANAVDPDSSDYCIWNKSGSYLLPDQPVVDAAYYASAIIKAPNQLWELQPENVKQNILKAFDLVLLMKPWRNNWLLFTAMIESCKYMLTGVGDSMRIEYAVTKHYEWYVGDGAYGDGEYFAWDYYNSYVIQPMLEEVSRIANDLIGDNKYRERIVNSLRRYSEIQERMIAPDGSYPFIGRSITYRMAAFQALAHCACIKMLPDTLPPSQVRTALNKVIEKAMSAETLFDENGFLTKGLYGKQESLTNYYTNTGSLYICTTIFLPLGLPCRDEFWKGENMSTTWEKVWSGIDMDMDNKIM